MTLVTIPVDPTRTLALAACWPGIGWRSFTRGAWVPAFDASCVLRFAPVPEDPAWQRARVCAPAPADIELHLYALDATGQPIRPALDVETLPPDPADWAPGKS